MFYLKINNLRARSLVVADLRRKLRVSSSSTITRYQQQSALYKSCPANVLVPVKQVEVVAKYQKLLPLSAAVL